MFARLFNLLILSLLFSISYSQVNTEGYYKDVFMDGGVGLYSKVSMTAIDSLQLSMEYLATESNSVQYEKMISSNNDYNGALLYPDGSPRYRIIYTNGGSATTHGNSLGSSGRDVVRTFYDNGGSYSGSCAGAFLTSISYQSTGLYNPYYHIWPGRTKTTGVLSSYTGQFITTNSPLLQYYNFGGDHYIDSVFHDGGCFARENLDFPSTTEVLLRFDYPNYEMHNKASCWAYKENNNSGRLVVIGSHPENADSGERLHLMEAILQYAIAGKGDLKTKTTLVDGVIVNMNKATSQNDPEHTKIGDKQYHHFKINVPQNNTNISINVNAQSGYSLNIYLAKDDFAFKSNAQFADTSKSNTKTLNINNLQSGTYFVSVELDSTVSTIQKSWGEEYTGNLSVLNGISYSIQLDISTAIENVVSSNKIKIYPNPNQGDFTLEVKNTSVNNELYQMEVYSAIGQLVHKEQIELNTNISTQIHLPNLNNGVYYLQLATEDKIKYRTKVIIKR